MQNIRISEKQGSAYNSNIVLVIIFILGVYIDIGIFIGGVPVFPFAISFFAGTSLLLLHLARFIRLFWLILLPMMLLLTFLSLINSFYSPNSLVENVLGTSHLIYTMLSCFGLYLGLRAISERDLRRISFAALILLSVAVFLEVTTPFRHVSDAFRAFTFRDQSVYAADLRDLTRYGAVRPKAFSREPSFVALFFSIFSIAYIYLAKRGIVSTTLIASGVTIFGIYFIRSPIVLIIPLSAVLYVCFIYQLARQRYFWVNQLSIVFLIGLVLVIVGGAWILNESQNNEVLDGSVFIRVIAPVYTTFFALSEAPFFGFGLGVERELNYQVISYLSSLGSVQYVDPVTFNQARQGTLLNNSFFGIIVALGLIGSTMFFLILRLFWVVEGNRLWGLVLLLTILPFNAVGGVVTIKTWFIFFLFSALLLKIQAQPVVCEQLDENRTPQER